MLLYVCFSNSLQGLSSCPVSSSVKLLALVCPEFATVIEIVHVFVKRLAWSDIDKYIKNPQIARMTVGVWKSYLHSVVFWKWTIKTAISVQAKFIGRKNLVPTYNDFKENISKTAFVFVNRRIRLSVYQTCLKLKPAFSCVAGQSKSIPLCLLHD